MSPGRVLDEVLDFAKDSGGDMLRGLGRQVSDNPMPTVLIAAGIIWMTMGNKSTNGTARAEADGRGMGDGAWNAPNSSMQTGSDLGAKAGSAVQGAKDTAQSAALRLGSAASAVGDTASSAFNAVAGTASRTASTVKSAAGTLADSTKALEQNALAATRGLVDFCKNQPLMLAGLGLALGAGLGAAIPESEGENRLMGEAADQIKEKAEHLATEQMQTAKTVGQHMVEETAKLAKEELAGVVDKMQEQKHDEDEEIPSGDSDADTCNIVPLNGQPGLQQVDQQSPPNHRGL
jgi:gas vesicle protein